MRAPFLVDRAPVSQTRDRAHVDVLGFALAGRDVFFNKLALHWQILIGMFLEGLVGLGVNIFQGPIDGLLGDAGILGPSLTLVSLNDFVGDLFLRGLRFIAVPIDMLLIVGASSLNDLQKLSASVARPSASTCARPPSRSPSAWCSVAKPGTFVRQLRDSW